MKKTEVILIAIIAFLLGVFSFYLYNLKTNQVQMKITANMQNNNQTSQSGRYERLQFESLKRVGDTFYIKFSKQLESVPRSNNCAVDGSDDGIKPGCNPIDLYQTKINPDINISKEYAFTNYGTVTLISYDIFNDSWTESLPVDFFHKYITKSEKPKVQYYGGSVENPTSVKFNVIMLDGEIVNISEVYES